MELAGSRSIVLDAGIAEPLARTTSGDEPNPDRGEDEDNNRNDDESVPDDDQPAAHGNHKADNETGSNDGPEDASVEPSIRRGADGFPDTLRVAAWAHDPDLAATKVAAGLFDQLGNEYAHVIVAAPPVLKTITASVVTEYADAVLLVLSMGMTRRRDLSHAADKLRATGAPLTGAVLSETKPAPDVVCSDNDRKRSDTVSKAHEMFTRPIWSRAKTCGRR